MLRFTEAELCPDCSTPFAVVDLAGYLLRFYHDETCPLLRARADRNRRLRVAVHELQLVPSELRFEEVESR